MGLLSKEEIVSALDLKHEDVEVPEWGGTVRVRGYSTRERDLISALASASQTQEGEAKAEALALFRLRTVAACIVDEEGNRLFGDDELAELGKKSPAVVERLFAKAQELSGTGSESKEDAKANLEETESGSSGSRSRKRSG